MRSISRWRKVRGVPETIRRASRRNRPVYDSRGFGLPSILADIISEVNVVPKAAQYSGPIPARTTLCASVNTWD